MNTQISDVRSENFDGFNVLCQALLFGAKVKVMPGQLFLIEGEDQKEKTAFVHSVALSTRLSTITFVLQKRFRRAIHQRKKVPVPVGATFSYFAKKDPIKYAKKIGYPVVVKEVFGENPAFAVYNVNNPEELVEAIAKVKAHLPTTAEHEPASYAQTINLSSAEMDEDGTRTKSDKARFLIEKQLQGEHYRSYVVNGKHVLTLQKESNVKYEVEPPEKVKHIAEQAVSVISGLANGTVDIVSDMSGGTYVVELSERFIIPDACQNRLSVCDKVFSNLLLSEVNMAGLKLRSKKTRGTYNFSFYGITSSTDFVSSLTATAAELGAKLSVLSIDDVAGMVAVSLKSEAILSALFIEKVFYGHHISSLTVERKKSIKKKFLFG
ncbi:hypothetical protein [Vreelandella zhaodongensis]|uniref:ATP-grasp domain-containing protein n=1 Tax=Vreelandella zhaodongensis TaxID=1176240 RepID=A0ABX2SM80_VREZH|nr:hypothetical protein [Halomonas zhaodongensis]NYS43400.1 hypothetical protein [Halomonas zhaodongensis]